MKNLAKLAMLDEKCTEGLKKDLDEMIDMVKILDEIECEEILAEKKGFLREDVAEKYFSRDEMLFNAPLTEDGYVVVPKIVR